MGFKITRYFSTHSDESLIKEIIGLDKKLKLQILKTFCSIWVIFMQSISNAPLQKSNTIVILSIFNFSKYTPNTAFLWGIIENHT